MDHKIKINFLLEIKDYMNLIFIKLIVMVIPLVIKKKIKINLLLEKYD
jgi:hypothetical protein